MDGIFKLSIKTQIKEIRSLGGLNPMEKGKSWGGYFIIGYIWGALNTFLSNSMCYDFVIIVYLQWIAHGCVM